MGGRLILDGGTLNLNGGTLILDGGMRPFCNLSTGYKDLLVLMTSSLFSWRHNLKIFDIKNLTKNGFNKQKILLLSLTNRFLDRGANLLPPRTNRV